MTTQGQVLELIKQARKSGVERKFTQAIEMVVTLKDIDTKKQEMNVNEVIFLPNRFGSEPKICVIASGDLALRAEKAQVDKVVMPDELNSLATNKRKAKKLARTYSFFLAETGLMATIGRLLGPYLGPRGRMPAPLPPNAPIEAMVKRFRQSVRMRGKGQLSIACKVGDVKMDDNKLAENIATVLTEVERKLPSGPKNVKELLIKMSMGKPAKIAVKGA